MEERLQQLNYETHEVAETERKLESDLKKPIVSLALPSCCCAVAVVSLYFDNHTTHPLPYSFFIYEGISQSQGTQYRLHSTRTKCSSSQS